MEAEEEGLGLLSCKVANARAVSGNGNNVSIANASNVSHQPDEDEEHFLQVQYLLSIALICVAIFGMVGNLMSLNVLVFKIKGKNSFLKLLASLALSDALFLLFAFLCFGLPSVSQWYRQKLFNRSVVFVFGAIHTARTASVLLTLSVNVERFYAIVFPLKHFRWKKYLLWFSFSFSVLYNLPKWFEICFQEMEMPDGTFIAEMGSRGIRRHHVYMALYVFWSKFLLLECLPYFTIIVCNFCIVAKMMKSNNFRKKFRNVEEQQQPRSEVARECITRSIKFCRSGSGSRGGGRRSWRRRAASAAGEEASSAAADQRQSPRTSLSPASAPERPSVKKQRAYFQRKQKEEHQMGYILNVMSLLFVVCQMPKLIPDLYEVIMCSEKRQGRVCYLGEDMRYVVEVSHLTVCLNSALNFLIYTMGGAKYRKAFIDSYYSGAEACRWWRKTSPSSSAASAMAASPVSPNCTPEANRKSSHVGLTPIGRQRSQRSRQEEPEYLLRRDKCQDHSDPLEETRSSQALDSLNNSGSCCLVTLETTPMQMHVEKGRAVLAVT